MAIAAHQVEVESRPYPPGLWVLIFTETWERFSHYGMRAILILYLTTRAQSGGLGLDKPRAAAIFGGYLLAIYLFGIIGGQISDGFLGPGRTILLGGSLIVLGQLLLQVSRLEALFASLVLIAVGTCLLKPTVASSVGRLFVPGDPRRDGAFTMECIGINLGAMLAPLICGYMAEQPGFLRLLARSGLHSRSGWAWAFGLSGVGMALGLLGFQRLRHQVKDASLTEGAPEPGPRSVWFVAILVAVLLGLAWMVIASPSWPVQLLGGVLASAGVTGMVRFLTGRGLIQTRQKEQRAVATGARIPMPREDRKRIGVVVMMCGFSATFYFVFQQAGSSLSLFAKEYTNRWVGGFEVPASWFQTLNAMLIVALGPLFVWLWRFRAGRFPSSPVKFAMGILLAALGFLLLVPAAHGARPTPASPIHPVAMGWLCGVYLLHTLGELCISPVGMSYVSKLAPHQISSQLMGLWFFAIGIGSYLAGRAAGFMDILPPYQIFAFCAVIALAMGLLLGIGVQRTIFRLLGGFS
jgi:POT family proton-dependent oligopeptide transporter